jgi:septum formation protein
MSCSVLNPGQIVIAADTIVVIDGKILGKPRSVRDATAMLQRLSGREHMVYTGVAIYRNSSLLSAFHEVTRVRFRKLDLREIREYVKSGLPMDKAGAYGIQDDFGISFAEKIHGDYFNVVGLPVCHTYLELRKILGR